MCSRPTFSRIKCAIFAGAPTVEGNPTIVFNAFAAPVSYKTLHFIGSRDDVVFPRDSEAFAARFENAIAKHDSHCFLKTVYLLKVFSLTQKHIPTSKEGT